MQIQALTKQIPTAIPAQPDPLIVIMDEWDEIMRVYDSPVVLSTATELELEARLSVLARRMVSTRPTTLDGCLRGLEYLHRIVDEDHELTATATEMMRNCIRTLRKMRRDGIR